MKYNNIVKLSLLGNEIHAKIIELNCVSVRMKMKDNRDSDMLSLPQKLDIVLLEHQNFVRKTLM